MKARKLAKRINGTKPAVIAAPRKAAQAGPTPERLRHAADYETAADGLLKGRVRIKPMLEVLHGRGVIDAAMYAAGIKYETHWEGSGAKERFAQLRMDGTPGGSTEHQSDAMMRHKEEYTRAVRDLGITLSRVVEEVVCRNKSVGEVVSQQWKGRDQARAAGTSLLCVGLERLVKLWGL